MSFWKHISAFLIVPLGTPVTFAVWSGIAFEPRSFTSIISVLQAYIILTAPVAYTAALLFGIPAVRFLSRNMRLTFPAIIAAGTLIGTISGLMAGFYIGSYDMNGMLEYFTMDLISIYAPSTISGMVCSIIYWVIRRIS